MWYTAQSIIWYSDLCANNTALKHWAQGSIVFSLIILCGNSFKLGVVPSESWKHNCRRPGETEHGNQSVSIALKFSNFLTTQTTLYWREMHSNTTPNALSCQYHPIHHSNSTNHHAHTIATQNNTKSYFVALAYILTTPKQHLATLKYNWN